MPELASNTCESPPEAEPSFLACILFVLGVAASAYPGLAGTEQPAMLPRSAVEVVLSAPAESSSESPVPAEIRYRRHCEVEDQAAATTIPGRLTLELPGDDPVALEITAPGLWLPPVVVDAAMETVRVPSWPLGTVRAELVPPRNGELPEDFQPVLEFTAVPRSADDSGSPLLPEGRHRLPCERKEEHPRHVTCPAPAFPLDLTLAVPGHASIHRWGVEPGVAALLDLGTVPLRPGASLVGWVEPPAGAGTGEGGNPWKSVTTRLEPQPLSPENAEQSERFAGLGRTTTPNERGFFQLTGLDAGAHLLTLRHPEHGLLRLPVTLEEGRETALGELALVPFSTLSLRIDPPRDPSDRPWTVGLQRRSSTPDTSERVTEATPLPGGQRRWSGLEAGTYTVEIEDSRGSSWHREAVEVVGDPVQLDVHLDLVRLEGRITFQDEPVPGAKVWVGGRNFVRSIRSQTLENGRFYAYVPPFTDRPYVNVDVEASEPGLKHTFYVEPFVPMDGSDRVSLHLEFPETELGGRVLAADGTAVAGAWVRLRTSPLVSEHTRSDAAGRFTFRGAPPGPWRIQAGTGDETAVSRVAEVEVEDGVPAGPVELRLAPQWTLRGRLTTVGGAPIAGATVLASPALGDRETRLFPPDATTDPEGLFEMPLPAPTETVALTAYPPGHAVTQVVLDARPLRPAEDAAEPLELVALAAQPRGGTLRLHLEVDPENPAIFAGNRVELFGRHAAGAWMKRRWLQANGFSPRQRRWDFVHLAPGPWTLCYDAQGAATPPPDAPCVTGWVTPGGETEVTLHAPPDSGNRAHR